MLNIALKPTPIVPIKRFDELPAGSALYFKRDDLTGFEVSGNKIRKLEFAVDEALKQGATLILTCGGHQSNHCRATTAVGAQLGIPVHLFLRKSLEPVEANLFLDQLLGATIHWQDAAATAEDLLSAMKEYAEKAKERGEQPYIIPMGASNGIGALGYLRAFDEIVAFEKSNGFQFDAIVSAIGSGGTFAGLLLGQMKYNHPAHHIGMSVSGSSTYFKDRVLAIVDEALPLVPELSASMTVPHFTIVDQYCGPAYGQAPPAVYSQILRFAQSEGILLDPVYTGKAFWGLTEALKDAVITPYKKILFIHTGGAFALFAHKEHFIMNP